MASLLLSDDTDLDNQITIGGIRNSRLTRNELTALMWNDTRRARDGDLTEPKIVVSSNGLVIAKYHQDKVFKQLIDSADIVDVDGMPLVFATRLLCKTPLQERVATTDFVKDASALAANEGIRFYFLGAQGDTAQIAARNLQRAYPGLQIVGARNGYFSLEEEASLCDEIVRSGADILWLGLGSPTQEAFALRNRHRLSGLAWIRTCGGLFDFYSERMARAPQWMQSAGMEWLFRVFQEPRRLGKRYMLTNPVALYHLITKTHD